MKLHQTSIPGQFEALSCNVYIIIHKIPVHLSSETLTLRQTTRKYTITEIP